MNVVHAWSHEWDSGYDTKWMGQNAQQVIDETCKVSHLTAFQMSKTKDPIFFSTGGLDHPMSPKMLPLNSTAGEQVKCYALHNSNYSLFHNRLQFSNIL